MRERAQRAVFSNARGRSARRFSRHTGRIGVWRRRASDAGKRWHVKRCPWKTSDGPPCFEDENWRGVCNSNAYSFVIVANFDIWDQRVTSCSESTCEKSNKRRTRRKEMTEPAAITQASRDSSGGRGSFGARIAYLHYEIDLEKVSNPTSDDKNMLKRVDKSSCTHSLPIISARNKSVRSVHRR